MLGLTNSILFYANAAAFVVGGILVEKKLFGMNFENIMIVFSCVIFGAQAIGQATSLLPDYTKAKLAINNLFELFDRKPLIDNFNSSVGECLNDLDSQNEIAFDSVDFHYPTRPESSIFNQLNLTIHKGQRIALVGSSGCGKSTITQLLERFYDPVAGNITVNGKKLSDINLYWLRSQIGIVSQEPILFDCSIAENIAYGDNSRQVSMDEIQAAAMQANIHDFIINLPKVILKSF
jgi:ATP-binding cassette subfamily B (MDR/TAP) protein 1